VRDGVVGLSFEIYILSTGREDDLGEVTEFMMVSQEELKCKEKE
jgi:hypothetical protein